MAKRGKRYRAAAELVDRARLYAPDEALALIKQMPAPRFDETILASVRLGIDPTKSDQMVRGAVTLPKGLGRERKVLVFAQGEKVQEARAAGADLVGLDEILEQIAAGDLPDVDVVIATPDVMGKVAKVAKILGPRGLMPNPKSGTVTFDVGQAVREAKLGKVAFRADKGGNVHVPIGKRSFPVEDLRANLDALMDALIRAKPAASKGIYLRQLYVSGAMSPSVPVDISVYRR